jgi:hypothetical protein
MIRPPIGPIWRPATRTPAQAHPLRSWRTAVGLTAVAGGVTIVVGAFMPWVEAFAGLVHIPGVRGINGRVLAVMGVLIAVTGLFHAIRGGNRSRWLMGVAGFAATAFSGYLLIRLVASVHTLGGDSMVIARSGPGLWVAAAGSVLAFSTLLFPSSSQATLVARDPGHGLLAWAADQESAGARRGLQVILGLLWVVDAALQYQPFMFGRAFVTQTLNPATMGNPALIANPALAANQLILHNVVAWNAAFATIQLALGVGLLWRRTVRAALAGTIIWSLVVWWFGEGLGGLLTGSATPITGAPGAAILYAVVALVIWPGRRDEQSRDAVAAASPLGRRGSRLIWLVLWGGSAVLLLQSAVRAPRALHDTIASLASGEPGWIAALDRGAAAAAGAHGTVISITAAAVFLVIAAGVYLPATARPALVLGVLGALAIWAVGEDFGGILTGRATDPNSGPLLILLAAAFWPLRSIRPGPSPRPASSPAESQWSAGPGLEEVAAMPVPQPQPQPQPQPSRAG